VLTVTDRLCSCESTERDGDSVELATTSAPVIGVFGATIIAQTTHDVSPSC